MTKLLNLVTDELRRARGFYLLLVAFVLITESLMISSSIRSNFRILSGSGNTDYSQLITNLSAAFDGNMIYILIIGATGFALLAYAVFSWIRDWYFQGNFIYRLLTLPGNRASVAYAKLISILIMMAGILILQLILFYITNTALSIMFKEQYTSIPVLLQLATRMDTSIILLPVNPLHAFEIYGIGLWFLFSLMNSLIILLSTKGHTWIKTITTTIIYWFISFVLISLMVWATSFLPLTSTEMTILALGLIYSANIINGYLMSWLMNHYVSV